MANRYTNAQTYQGQLYTPPLEMMGKMLEITQAKYDSSLAQAQQIKNNFIPSLPQDRALANTIQRDWEKRVDDIVKSYDGNYAKASRDLSQLTSDIRKEYNPGGKANAIVSNYGVYNDWTTRHRDRVAKGNVLAEDLNQANTHFMNNYQGVGEVDPLTGSYNRFNAEDLVDYMDPEKIIKDVYTTFKPEKRSQGVSYVGKDGFIHYDEMEFDGISEQRLNPSFNSALKSNPQYMAYLGQKSRIAGVPPEGAEQFVTALANQRAKDLSYMNMSSKNKLEANPYAVAKYKAGLDRENIDYAMSSMQYEPLTPNVAVANTPQVDPDNWRSSTAGFFGNVGDAISTFAQDQRLALLGINTANSNRLRDKVAAGVAGGAVLGSASATPLAGGVVGAVVGGLSGIGSTAGAYYDDASSRNKIAAENTSLDDFLTNGKNDNRLLDKNVNPGFARTLWQDMKQRGGNEFKSKYRKDRRYTAEVESKFWKEYKEASKDIGAFQAVSFDIPVQAKGDILKSIAPDIASGKAAWYRPGESSIRGSGENGEAIDSGIVEAMYADGKIQSDMIGLKYVQPGAGYAAAGYQIDTPQGSIVVVDQNKQRREASKLMESSLAPIYQHGRMRGGKGIAGIDKTTGMAILGTPEMRYSRNENNKWQGDLYWETDPGVYMKKSAAELQQEMIHVFGGALGFGQSKSDATPYSYFFNQ